MRHMPSFDRWSRGTVLFLVDGVGRHLDLLANDCLELLKDEGKYTIEEK